MNELKYKRSLSGKHYKNTDGSYTYKGFSGHQHYYNKLGVGDSINDYREIDLTLLWDDENKGWYFEYHSFHPFIPEYSNEWVEFRDIYGGKDQVIKFKAITSHVKGRLVAPSDIGIGNLTSVNCVIYDDAFGVGCDYIIYFTKTELKKVARVRDGYKDSKDMKFSWFIDIPTDKKIVRKDETGEYELDITRDKTFDTKKQTLIGITNNGDGDDSDLFTYLRSFKCWDSAGAEQVVDVEFNSASLKLTKIIPVDFISSSTGDIFTDTSVSYYSGQGDGYVISGYDATWSTHRTQATATGTYKAASTTGAYIELRTWYNLSQGGYYGMRGFFSIDTSSIPSYATITSATFKAYCAYVSSCIGTAVLTKASQASTSALTISDWGNLIYSTALSNTISLASSSDDGYKDFILNDLTAITKHGWTKLAIIGNKYVTNTAPTDKTDVLNVYTSEDTSGSKDPYLLINYTFTDIIPMDDLYRARRLRFMTAKDTVDTSVFTPVGGPTIEAAATLFSNGRLEKFFDLNGSSQYYTFDGSPHGDMRQGICHFFIKPDFAQNASSPSQAWVVDTRDSSRAADGISFQFLSTYADWNNHLLLNGSYAVNAPTVGEIWAADSVIHIVIMWKQDGTLDGGYSWKLFINNILKLTSSTTWLATLNDTHNITSYLGRYCGSANYFWDGGIYDFAFFDYDQLASSFTDEAIVQSLNSNCYNNGEHLFAFELTSGDSGFFNMW